MVPLPPRLLDKGADWTKGGGVDCSNSKMNNGTLTVTRHRKNGNFCHSPLRRLVRRVANATNMPLCNPKLRSYQMK